MAHKLLEKHPGVPDREMFLKHKTFLEDHINPNFGLLDKLMTNDALSTREVEDIEAKDTVFKRNSLLLSIISNTGNYDCLISALRDTNQSHLVNYLIGNGEYTSDFAGEWPLLKREMAILKANQEFLVDNLSMDELLYRLYATGVINKRQREFISSKPTSYEKNTEFVKIIRRHSLRGYLQTIRCLQESNQSHIARVLDHGGVVVRAVVSVEGEAGISQIEKEIVSKMDTLLDNLSQEEGDRVLDELRQLRFFRAATSHSVALYFLCIYLEEVDRLQEVAKSGELKKIVETVFSRLLAKQERILLKLDALSGSCLRAMEYFKDIASIRKEDAEEIVFIPTPFELLPTDLMDSILQKCYLQLSVNLCSHFPNVDVIRNLASVNYLWRTRMKSRQFKNKIWRYYKDLRLKVRLTLKCKRSEDDSDELRRKMNNLTDDFLHDISQLLEAKRKRQRRKIADLNDLRVKIVTELVNQLEHFDREMLSVETVRIHVVFRILCNIRYSVGDLRSLCGSDDFLNICRSSIIPTHLQSDIDVVVTVDQPYVHICIEKLDDVLPVILHKVFSAREIGIEVKTGDIAAVCQKWKIIVESDRFSQEHRRFIEGSMRPYLFAPVEMGMNISTSKPVTGVSVLRRCLYVAHFGVLFIDVFSIPDISTYDLSTSRIPDHKFINRIDVRAIQLPYSMAVSERSNCLYLNEFSGGNGCVWKVTPDGEVGKFADRVGRPIGVNVSRDDYVIIVSEKPNNIYVLSPSSELVLKIPLSSELTDPRQAICTGPGRFAIIHGYLDAARRVVEVDFSGHVLRNYEYAPVHWLAAVICDNRGRMVVLDCNNHQVHLLKKNFQLRRHLLQLDVKSVGTPRRFCIDEINGMLYVGYADSIKMFRVAYPSNSDGYGEEHMSAGKVFGIPSNTSEITTAAVEVAEKTRINLQKSIGPVNNLSEFPVEILQTIFLKAIVMSDKFLLLKSLSLVCRNVYNISRLMYFRYRLRQFIRGRKKLTKKRALETPLETSS